MSQKKDQKKDEKITPEQPRRRVAWHGAGRPNFVTLAIGEAVSGTFVGTVKTNFGIGYRFRGEDGVFFTMGGNRVQLDQVFQDLMGAPVGFIGNTIIGHSIAVRRLDDVESSNGNFVAQFEIGHLDPCAKGCRSPIRQYLGDEIPEPDPANGPPFDNSQF